MEDYRDDSIKPIKKKSKLIIKTNCAVHSLREVECFLHNLDKASRYIHLFKFLK